jgi:hypothetical protein
MWLSRPIAYMRGGEPMIEIGPHSVVNLAAAMRLGLVSERTL